MDGYLAFSHNDRYLGPCFTIEDDVFKIDEPLHAACSLLYGNDSVELVRRI